MIYTTTPVRGRSNVSVLHSSDPATLEAGFASWEAAIAAAAAIGTQGRIINAYFTAGEYFILVEQVYPAIDATISGLEGVGSFFSTVTPLRTRINLKLFRAAVPGDAQAAFNAYEASIPSTSQLKAIQGFFDGTYHCIIATEFYIETNDNIDLGGGE